MHIEKLKSIQECLASAAEAQVYDLENVDAQELGEVIDIIKDINFSLLVVRCQLLYFRDCITVSLAEIFDRHSREVFTQHFPLSSLHRSIHFRLHKSYRFVVNFFQDGT